MTLDEFVDKQFASNLELAPEEHQMNADLNDYIEYSERAAWNSAVEWTQEDVANYIGHKLENKWQAKQEWINKGFYG